MLDSIKNLNYFQLRLFWTKEYLNYFLLLLFWK
nr:MAG TPA: hypothetical protein [Caudoviricetes sp.]